MLTYYYRHSYGESFRATQSPPVGVDFWVRADQVSDDDHALLVSKYQLDSNILDDMHDRAELARVEYGGKRTYVFLRSIRRTRKGTIVTTPLLTVIDSKYFFLLSRCDNIPVQQKIEAGVVVNDGQQSTALFLSVAVALLEQYDELVHYTARVIRDTSQRLRTHEVVNQDFIHFVTVEDNLNEYDMNLSGMLAVMKRLRDSERSVFNQRDIEAIDDIILHIEQLLVGISTSSRRVDSIRNAHTTIANNNLNSRIKALTTLTVLITLPNVLFGMYGMNVALPFAESPLAYGIIMVVTLLLILAVYALARRMKVF